MKLNQVLTNIFMVELVHLEAEVVVDRPIPQEIDLLVNFATSMVILLLIVGTHIMNTRLEHAHPKVVHSVIALCNIH